MHAAAVVKTPPCQREPVEVLAVDFWPTLEGLTEHYRALLSTNGLDEVLAGSLTVSVWEAASGFVAW
jgi:hypothetical protein